MWLISNYVVWYKTDTQFVYCLQMLSIFYEDLHVCDAEQLSRKKNYKPHHKWDILKDSLMRGLFNIPELLKEFYLDRLTPNYNTVLDIFVQPRNLFLIEGLASPNGWDKYFIYPSYT